ncbi:hypothetical protein [Microbacterium sp. E-13]|uniref:hypothetical protein n=1 Tax=Microbacterium sp. E-13 TaxID=3404048 RepID=UPI003CF3AE21
MTQNLNTPGGLDPRPLTRRELRKLDQRWPHLTDLGRLLLLLKVTAWLLIVGAVIGVCAIAYSFMVFS